MITRPSSPAGTLPPPSPRDPSLAQPAPEGRQHRRTGGASLPPGPVWGGVRSRRLHLGILFLTLSSIPRGVRGGRCGHRPWPRSPPQATERPSPTPHKPAGHRAATVVGNGPLPASRGDAPLAGGLRRAAMCFELRAVMHLVKSQRCANPVPHFKVVVHECRLFRCYVTW